MNNFILIPNHFFIPPVIQKRKPLSNTARRAGWVGCNINLQNIAESGKIYIIKNSVEVSRQKVVSDYKKTEFLQTKNLESRGWLLDILTCVDRIPQRDFSLNDVYGFESELKLKHPENNFIKDKIRQQLQLLRDKNFIEFTGRGTYRKS